jgi:hypothetical protein
LAQEAIKFPYDIMRRLEDEMDAAPNFAIELELVHWKTLRQQ